MQDEMGIQSNHRKQSIKLGGIYYRFKDPIFFSSVGKDCLSSTSAHITGIPVKNTIELTGIPVNMSEFDQDP